MRLRGPRIIDTNNYRRRHSDRPSLVDVLRKPGFDTVAAQHLEWMDEDLADPSFLTDWDDEPVELSTLDQHERPCTPGMLPGEPVLFRARRSHAPVSGVTCKYCGIGGFHWQRTASGWRLADDEGELHLCRTLAARREREGE